MGPGNAEYETLRDLSMQLAHAAHGAKGALVQRAAEQLGITVDTLYRRMDHYGLRLRTRKQRADKGRRCVSEEAALNAAGLVVLATRANDKRTTPITLATELVAANGFGRIDPASGEIVAPSAATMSRAMRSYNCHPDQIAAGHPALTLRSLHPNHVWEVDSSVCTLFYAPEGGMRVQPIDEREVYKNKPDAVAKVAKDLCIRWLITDHASDACRLRYHAGTESAQSFIDFFIEAIQDRGRPMHGVPKILYMDPGSAARAATSRNLLERLGVRVIVHRSKNPRAKGGVEGGHNRVETQFEGRLALWNPPDLAALNARADEWVDAWCSSAIHDRHKRPRYAAWLGIREEQLVLAPPVEMCRELVTTKPETRVVSNQLTISYACPGYGSRDYDVRDIPGVAPKQKLDVVVNAYRAPAVDIIVHLADGSTEAHVVEPVEKDEYGFPLTANIIGEQIKALPKTAAERQFDAIRQAAYGLPTQAECDAARKARTDAYVGTIDPFADVKRANVPTYMPRRGTEHPVTAPARVRPDVPLLDAARRLIAAGADRAGLYDRLKAEFPAGAMPADELDRRCTRSAPGLKAVSG